MAKAGDSYSSDRRFDSFPSQKEEDMRWSIQRIRDLTVKDSKTLVEKALKLAEETGEVAEAVLSSTGSHGTVYKNKTDQDVLDECADVIILGFSIIYQMNPDIEMSEISKAIVKKLDKWCTKIDNNM